MYHHQFNHQVVHIHPANKVLHLHRMDRLVLGLIPAQEHKGLILALHKVCQDPEDRQVGLLPQDLPPRLQLQAHLLLVEILLRHHPVRNKKVTIPNTAQDQPGPLVKVR